MGGPALGVGGRAVASNGCRVAFWGAASALDLVEVVVTLTGSLENGESYVSGFYLNLKKFYNK